MTFVAIGILLETVHVRWWIILTSSTKLMIALKRIQIFQTIFSLCKNIYHWELPSFGQLSIGEREFFDLGDGFEQLNGATISSMQEGEKNRSLFSARAGEPASCSSSEILPQIRIQRPEYKQTKHFDKTELYNWTIDTQKQHRRLFSILFFACINPGVVDIDRFAQIYERKQSERYRLFQ